jgi:hypothetical protein
MDEVPQGGILRAFMALLKTSLGAKPYGKGLCSRNTLPLIVVESCAANAQ